MSQLRDVRGKLKALPEARPIMPPFPNQGSPKGQTECLGVSIALPWLQSQIPFHLA